MNRAVATVEIVGTAEARAAARAVYDSAKTVGEACQARSLNLATAERRIGIPRGSGLTSFDADRAQARCDTPSDAVDSFITAVRPESAIAESAKPRDTPGIRE